MYFAAAPAPCSIGVSAWTSRTVLSYILVATQGSASEVAHSPKFEAQLSNWVRPQQAAIAPSGSHNQTSSTVQCMMSSTGCCTKRVDEVIVEEPSDADAVEHCLRIMHTRKLPEQAQLPQLLHMHFMVNYMDMKTDARQSWCCKHSSPPGLSS